MAESSARHRLASLREGMTAQRGFEIGPDQMNAFAELSGDRSPIHQDAAFARERGFESEVVYGGLLVAEVSRLIGMELPGSYGVWHQLRIDFRRPLYVGRPAKLLAEITHVSEATSSVVLKFRVESAREVVATGTAGVRLVERG